MSPSGAVPPGLGGCGDTRLGVHSQRPGGVGLPLVLGTCIPECPTAMRGHLIQDPLHHTSACYHRPTGRGQVSLAS
jgi:hypothetical protein